MKHTIDATNKKIGRVATEAAVILMGKNSPDFARHAVAKVTVEIKNASKLSIPQIKRKRTVYLSHSQFPGGQKSNTMESVIAKKGYEEVLRKAVWGMLPTNKLRATMMKNLIISE